MENEQNVPDGLPAPAAAAVAAHAEVAGDGAHLATHDHVDDSAVADAASRFTPPGWAPGQSEQE